MGAGVEALGVGEPGTPQQVPVVEDLDDLVLVAVGEDTQALLVPPALDVVNGLGEHPLQEAGGGLAAAQEDDAGVEEAGEPSGLAGTPGDDNVGVALCGLLQHRLQDPRAEVGEPAVVVDPHHPLVERSEALEHPQLNVEVAAQAAEVDPQVEPVVVSVLLGVDRLVDVGAVADPVSTRDQAQARQGAHCSPSDSGPASGSASSSGSDWVAASSGSAFCRTAISSRSDLSKAAITLRSIS